MVKERSVTEKLCCENYLAHLRYSEVLARAQLCSVASFAEMSVYGNFRPTR